VREAYDLLAVSLKVLGKDEDALRMLEMGLQAVGHDAKLHFHMGRFLAEAGRYAEAKEHYLQVQSTTGRVFTSMDIGVLGPKLFANLGDVCNKLGDYQGARDWWRKGIAVAFAASLRPRCLERTSGWRGRRSTR
jgi:tetratricopeptide (TPR) repeat protein